VTLPIPTRWRYDSWGRDVASRVPSAMLANTEKGTRILHDTTALDRSGRGAMTRTAVPRDPLNYRKADLTLMRHGTTGFKGSTSPLWSRQSTLLLYLTSHLTFSRRHEFLGICTLPSTILLGSSRPNHQACIVDVVSWHAISLAQLDEIVGGICYGVHQDWTLSRS
jgi:hypothetical protein